MPSYFCTSPKGPGFPKNNATREVISSRALTDPSMQLLIRVYRSEEAAMIAEMLEKNAIVPVLQGENFSALYPVFPTRVSEIQIFVEESQWSHATDLLRSFFGKNPTPETRDEAAD